MLQGKYLNKLNELPEPVRKFGGLVTITFIVILSFAILNIFWGGGDELVRKMKLEEERIAKEKELSKLISSLPSGILVPYEGTEGHKLSKEQHEAVCNATTIVTQRALMGANLINFQAHKIYTINGNKIDETFVKWDKENKKCFAGYTVSGNNVGVNETIEVSGEALSFLIPELTQGFILLKIFREANKK